MILGVVPLIVEVAVEVNAVAHVIFLFGTSLVWKPFGKALYDDNSTLESFCQHHLTYLMSHLFFLHIRSVFRL